MIRSFAKLQAMRALDPELQLAREVPERGSRFAIWTVTPGGRRVHGNTARALIRRGFPVSSADLFDGGDA